MAFMRTQRASRTGPAIVTALLLTVPTGAPATEDDTGHDPGYEWMATQETGVASFVFGSPETAEDLLFWVVCNLADKASFMTVYVDIAGSKVGDAVAIDLGAGSAKTSVKGKIATDEMSGFLFAEAKNFKVKPVVELFKAKGPVTVKTGKVVTTLPEKGRGKALATFAKACTLD